MKKIIFLSIALISSSFSFASEETQHTEHKMPQQQHTEHKMPQHMMKKHMMKKHMANFDAELNLSEEQKEQIKLIREKHKELNKKARQAEMAEIKSVLTPEQRKKAEEMHSKMKEKMKEHMSKNKKEVSQ